MKVLVVDDELPIRTWIVSCLRKIKEPLVEVVGSAANGEEGLRIFNEKKPEVVLADITMPVMDGLTLLKKIRENEENTEVIILTCHSDFSYAREAISQKAYDYILKTEITPKKLSSMLLDIQEKQVRQVLPEQWVDIQNSREYAIGRVIKNSEKLTSAEIKALLTENHISLTENAMFAMAFHKNNWVNEGTKTEAISILDDRVDNIVFYSYKNDITILIGNIVCVSSVLYQKNVQYELAKKLSGRYQSQIGISDLYYSYRKIPEMLLQSVRILELEFYDDLIIYQTARHFSYQECAIELRDIRERMLDSIDEENAQAVKKEIYEIYSYIKNHPIYDIDLLKQYFISLLTGFLLKIYANEPREFIEKMGFYQSKILSARVFSEVKRVVNELLDEFVGVICYGKTHYSQHIRSAIEYMEKNYGGACSVADVADYIGLNPDYFSRLIKKETGSTFSQYLTDIRMKRAIYLLQNSDSKVYEIAEEVGYPNFGYFSKMFKKKFQITPFEFRNKMIR